MATAGVTPINNIIRKRKALTVRPLKTSQTVGAVLAFQGMANAMPLLHGSQGCTAFTKVAFVRHFREPIPIQTTAMAQTSTIMGADDNLIEALSTLAAKGGTDLIGVMTTGLSEVQGCDLSKVLARFRQEYPQWRELPIVPVNTPDFMGSLEMGYGLAVLAMVDHLVTPRLWNSATTIPQINVLVGPGLTPGDVEELRDLLQSFDLHAAILPDLSASLDGHLADEDYVPVTCGGTPLTFFTQLHLARATLVIGRSMFAAAKRLQQLCPMPVIYFDHLMGLDTTDRLVMELCHLCGTSAPSRVDRWRRQFQDAMLDSHFYLNKKRVAIAGEVELVAGFHQLLSEIGAHTVAAVVPDCSTPIEGLVLQVGDLDDLESWAKREKAELLVGNSQLATTATRLNIPLMRAGFPIFDRLGGFRQTCIGYRGGRDTLFALANLFLASRSHGIAPYCSRLRPGDEKQHLLPEVNTTCA